MDAFFSQQNCDRCGGDLTKDRTMSAFSQEVICMDCKDKEKQDPGYKRAVDADIEQIKQGYYNFSGIRGKKGDK
jgi:hypothetical protein